MPPRQRVGGGGVILIYPCLSVRPSGYRCMVCPAISSYSYSFNILYDVLYTHNGGVHVHRTLIFIKYLIMTGSWTFYAPATKSRWGGGGGDFYKYSQNDR